MTEAGRANTAPATDEQSTERSVSGLAAELKNLLRGDQMYRSEQARRIQSKETKSGR